MREWMMPETFDAGKFKARYGLSDSDFQYKKLNGQWYVRVSKGITLPYGAPIFDAPDPQVEQQKPLQLTPGTLKTPQVGALEIVDDGVNGQAFITLHVDGVITRVRIA